MSNLDQEKLDRAIEMAREAMRIGECAFWAIRRGIQEAWGDEAAALIAPSDATGAGTKDYMAPPAYIAVRTGLGLPWPKEWEYVRPETKEAA